MVLSSQMILVTVYIACFGGTQTQRATGGYSLRKSCQGFYLPTHFHKLLRMNNVIKKNTTKYLCIGWHRWRSPIVHLILVTEFEDIFCVKEFPKGIPRCNLIRGKEADIISSVSSSHHRFNICQPWCSSTFSHNLSNISPLANRDMQMFKIEYFANSTLSKDRNVQKNTFFFKHVFVEERGETPLSYIPPLSVQE